MAPPLEIGLILSLTMRGLALPTYEAMRRAAIEAERWGFDSIWTCDHFFTLDPSAYVEQAGIDGKRQERGAGENSPSVPLLEAWTALTALARDTHRLRLGTSVLCVSYRSPSVLAKMGATLDLISGGRFELGIGAGWMKAEYEAYGFPFPRASERIAQLEEAVQIIKRMWTEKSPSFEGIHFRIRNAICDPAPAKKPRPSIRVGGEGRKVLGVAARHADGYNVRWWPPERFLERAPEIEAACRSCGRDPATLQPSVMLMLIPERSRAAAQAERQRYGAVPSSGIVAGTPTDCATILRPYIRAGVRSFLFTIPRLIEHPERLRLAGEEVLPAVRGFAAG